MMNKKVCLLLFAAITRAGVAAAEIVLPETLGVGWIDSPDALSQVGYCFPEVTMQKLEELRARADNATIVQFRKSSDKNPYLILSGDRFACIDRNGAGKPILPAQIFEKFFRLEGATEHTTMSLYRSLAMQLATRGVADALVKFSNGNAMELSVFVTEDAPVAILYAVNFIKAAEYDETKYRFVVSAQVKSVSTTSYGSSGQRAVGILQDELAPRPLRGEFLLGKGTGQTQETRFEDTAWRFSKGGSISLAAGGALIFKPKTGDEKRGTWLVENGVLYLNYGNIFGSAVLDKDSNLSVEFRNPKAEPRGLERRWVATLEKS